MAFCLHDLDARPRDDGHRAGGRRPRAREIETPAPARHPTGAALDEPPLFLDEIVGHRARDGRAGAGASCSSTSRLRPSAARRAGARADRRGAGRHGSCLRRRRLRVGGDRAARRRRAGPASRVRSARLLSARLRAGRRRVPRLGEQHASPPRRARTSSTSKRDLVLAGLGPGRQSRSRWSRRAGPWSMPGRSTPSGPACVRTSLRR